MISAEEQKQVLFLVRQTKDLILKEMKNEEVMVKGAANYVTNVDLAVQNFLKEELGKAFPDIALIAEEKENTGLSEEETYWILDPIDGTANLILDFRMSAVALGLYEKGEIVFGAVFNPFTDELFHAAKGEGAYLNGNAIHASSTEHFGDAVISYGSTPYTKSEAKNLFPIFYNIFMKCGDFRRTGSAELDMCYVACGREHGYLERDLKPWDYSAGTIIVREAGGVVRTWKGEEPTYLTNGDILACALQFEEILLKELAGEKKS